jgi:hypothetical protein
MSGLNGEHSRGRLFYCQFQACAHVYFLETRRMNSLKFGKLESNHVNQSRSLLFCKKTNRIVPKCSGFKL